MDIGVVGDLVLLEDFGAVIGVDIDNDITVVHEVGFANQSVGISARIVNDIVLVKNLVLDLCRNGFYRKRKVAAEVPAQLQMDNKHKGGDTILSEMISIKWTPPTTLKS